MPEFRYTVTVVTETQEQAEQVMAERINFEEDYEDDRTGGFIPYSIDWNEERPAWLRS